MLPSSRGLGHIPFTDAAGVQIPLGVPFNEELFEESSFFVPKMKINKLNDINFSGKNLSGISKEINNEMPVRY